MTKEKKEIRIPLEEEIWGFRLYDQEDRQIVFLEFLFAIFNAPVSSDTCNLRMPQFSGSSHLVLRALIFSNPEINFCSDWDDWIPKFSKNMGETFFQLTNWNPEYLKDFFNSFNEFKQVLIIIRQSLDKKDVDRKWNYRFLFPWSKDQIFPDVEFNSKNTDTSTLACKRHYFVHTGEIAYLLCLLSKNRNKLLEKLKEKFKSSDNPLARLCEILEKGYSDSPQVPLSINSAFLPKQSHSDRKVLTRAEWLAEDIPAILNLNLKSEDTAEFLSRIIGLHLICYYLERAKFVALDPRLKGDGRFFMLCEIPEPESTPVRKQARLNFQQNQKLGFQVLLEIFNKKISEIENAPDTERARLFSTVFNTTAELEEEDREELEEDPNSFKNRVKDSLEKKFIKHLGNFHQRMAIDIGLASREFTVAYRYILSDELLLTLVYAVVKENFVPMKGFLKELRTKFGIVIDEASAMEYAGDIEIETNDLVMNYKRLLGQLNGLGLLYHLSDGCDYVQNPYIVAQPI